MKKFCDPFRANSEFRGILENGEFIWVKDFTLLLKIDGNIILGNVRDENFSGIWQNTENNELLRKLKEKKKWVTGRCSNCKYLDLCAGGFRARAEAVTNDPWASDPACYLSDEEIGIL